ncbi:MAG: hypothetical protein ACQEWV_17465 [Bacillota bacterium]
MITLLEEASHLDSNKYTDKSYHFLQTAVTKAESVLLVEDESDKKIDKAYKNLVGAINDLEIVTN